ncbi:MAG: TspO/MBR family protein [bacterium]
MNYKKLIICFVLPQLAGAIGSLFTAPSITGWYMDLIKPSFSPPNWIFGPVWITLYLMMGLSAYLVWNSKNKKAVLAFNLFLIHLFFNTVWSIIFFGMQNPGLAFLDIIILLIFIIVLIIKFYNINKIASYLLIPYFLWVSFASALNYFIWVLN